jgi:hypothetical protein
VDQNKLINSQANTQKMMLALQFSQQTMQITKTYESIGHTIEFRIVFGNTHASCADTHKPIDFQAETHFQAETYIAGFS